MSFKQHYNFVYFSMYLYLRNSWRKHFNISVRRMESTPVHLLSVTQKKFPLRRRLTALKTTATLTQQNLMKMAPSLASMVMGNLEQMPPTPQPCLQLYSSATETDLQMCCCTFMDSNTLIPFCCIRPSAVKSDWIRGIPSFSSTGSVKVGMWRILLRIWMPLVLQCWEKLSWSEVFSLLHSAAVLCWHRVDLTWLGYCLFGTRVSWQLGQWWLDFPPFILSHSFMNWCYG